MTKTLTDRFIQGVKPTGAIKAYTDTVVKNLSLRVMPSGHKSWSVRYKVRGRGMRVTLGDVTTMTLAAARVKARELLLTVTNGGNPAAEKQAARTAQTMQDLAEQYIEEWAKPRKKSWKADDNLLRRKILPRWRHRAITDITRKDCIALVRGVAEKAPIVANRVGALLSKIFSFALDLDLVQHNPATRIHRPGKEQQRDRVLSEDEVRTLWQSFSALEPSMAAFYKLRLLTAQRGGEVAAMRHQDLELVSGWWTIQKAATKNNLAHRVPLGPTSLALIKSLQQKEQRLGSAPATYVLVGARGKRQQAEAAATFTVPNFRGHDLRRTAASMMASAGVARLTISKILNHVESHITAVYDRHSYDAEKASALAWWDARVLAIIENKSSTVLPFSRQA